MTQSVTQTVVPASSGAFDIPYMSGNQIRQSFVDFFRSKDHIFSPSSPVVPHDDPTLLFINAGMNQFKSNLLGDNKEGWKRVVNSQKCIRVSGKHNDLDEVGRDTYHHTFFEMLGNWSFGDYYKREAIAWAWELLTEVWKLPKDRLFVSVFRDDDEAVGIWTELGVEPSRILRFGEQANFWEMGEVGPCGPSSEIHFDIGDLQTQAQTFNNPVEGVNGQNARYIEIWNLVFMQFERLSNGDLKPLRTTNVDTGMGFERICSIIQGTGSNYETDMFKPLIAKVAELSGTPYAPGEEGTPHRVIADHLRALTFAIADGATPGNEGRGYVLRRILRRASRFARNLNQKEPFLWKLVPTLAESMATAYPELLQRQDYVAQVIRAEEERFMRTLDQGLERFARMADEVRQRKQEGITGADVFTLYDTFGFPVDLTRILAEEQGLSIDLEGYESHMREQRERARSAAKFDGSFAGEEGWTLLSRSLESQFVGHDQLTYDVSVLRYREMNDFIFIVLDRTPFYAEAGGQVGDTGILSGPDIQLRVVDTVKVMDMVIHKCSLIQGLLTSENLKNLTARVDEKARFASMRNHSATHLLHAALRSVLGEHVQQQGSRVSPEGLRFDFTHFQAMTAAEIIQVEDLVNERIQADLPVSSEVKSLAEAKEIGAMALFGEKYGENVRVIKMGDFSLELCGGTHTKSTGQVGFFKILGEASVASGVRRIEAVSGPGAVELARKHSHALSEISKTLKARPGQELEKVQELSVRIKSLEREVEELRAAQASLEAESLLSREGKKIDDAQILITRLDPIRYDKEKATRLMDGLATRLVKGIAVITLVSEDTLNVLVLVGKELHAKAKAGDIIRELNKHTDGRGGGRADRAQAGSRFPEKESLVLYEAEKTVHAMLGK